MKFKKITPKVSLKTPLLEFGENDFLNTKSNRFATGNLNLNAALHYASLGCPVFPVQSILTNEKGERICSCRASATCERQGKHPRTINGLNDATTDAETIRDWWEKYTDSNIGLLTGRQARLFVLDIDIKYGGEFSLAYLQEFYQDELRENFSPLPETLIATTGSGGRHIFFKYPKDILISGSVSEIGSGLDIRAESNYVVVAPSNHISGNSYSWQSFDTPILDAPDWLIYEIISPTVTNNLASQKQRPNNHNSQKIKDGEGRHERFWRYLCGLVNSFSEKEILELALAKNLEMLEPPKSESYVKYQVKYLCGKYSKEKDLGLKK